MNWTGIGRKRSWSNQYIIPTFAGGAEENHESLKKYSVRDFNTASLEYESRPLILHQSTQFACSVNNGYANEYGEAWQMQTRKKSFERKANYTYSHLYQHFLHTGGIVTWP
jgi:hypothetical protein